MFDINQIYKIDNLLDDNKQSILEKYTNQYTWTFTGFSNDINAKMFWKKDFWGEKFGYCEELETIFREIIQNSLGLKLETCDLYLNGQAHGQCGSFHTDVPKHIDGDFITAVYFPLKFWNPEWGGFTVILDINNNPHIIYPKPNSVVIFNSRFPHVGLEPTVHCNGQRVSLAHKFKIIG